MSWGAITTGLGHFAKVAWNFGNILEWRLGVDEGRPDKSGHALNSPLELNYAQSWIDYIDWYWMCLDCRGENAEALDSLAAFAFDCAFNLHSCEHMWTMWTQHRSNGPNVGVVGQVDLSQLGNFSASVRSLKNACGKKGEKQRQRPGSPQFLIRPSKAKEALKCKFWKL